MPDFQLTDDEAAALEAYLRREATAQIVTAGPSEADPDRGRQLYSSLGCGNCHPVDGLDPAETRQLTLALLSGGDLGCLATRHENRGSAPDFRFTSIETDALRSFLATDRHSLTQSAPLETAARLVRQLRCMACHDRDGQFAPRTTLTFDEGILGRAPEDLPGLTWTGEKLRSDWVEGFLAGRIESPRPWLKSRMPNYPRYAAAIAAGLAAEHGLPAESPAAPQSPDASRAEIGRQLTLETALDCRQCHGVGDMAPRGDERTLTAPGTNFVDVRHRLHREFFLRLLHDPLRVDPVTKMPKLSESGRTKITEHYDGNAVEQFQAIWVYVQSLEDGEGKGRDGIEE
jgi:mono/diheme cytochrome c family protein